LGGLICSGRARSTKETRVQRHDRGKPFSKALKSIGRHTILNPGNRMTGTWGHPRGSVLRVNRILRLENRPMRCGQLNYSVVAARASLGLVAGDQRKNRSSHNSQRNGRTKSRARIIFSTIPLRLDWWILALSQFGQQIILLLLRSTGSFRIVRCKRSCWLFPFGHTSPTVLQALRSTTPLSR